MEHILGVLGTGTMGTDIVQLAAQSGYRVLALACDASVEALERAQVCVDGGLSHLANGASFPRARHPPTTTASTGRRTRKSSATPRPY